MGGSVYATVGMEKSEEGEVNRSAGFIHERGGTMKVLITALFAASMVASVAMARTTAPSPAPGVEKQIVEHGGGCRKSSPPGQCCHMDNSTGRVHCH